MYVNSVTVFLKYTSVHIFKKNQYTYREDQNLDINV